MNNPLTGRFVGEPKVGCICLQCGIQFAVYRNQISRGGGKCCSRTCSDLSKRKLVSFRDDGYICIKRPGHHRANGWGFVYEHILVMEEKIGRDLLPQEEVHHRNRAPSDNGPANLRLFKNKTEHQRHHARERLVAKGINPDTERRCRKCLRILTRDQFSPSSSRGKKTLSSTCRECCKHEQQERRDTIKRRIVASVGNGDSYIKEWEENMTFQEAVAEMKVLAGGDDWAFQYQVASYLPTAEIHGYIARIGVGHAQDHNTYRGAIDNMKVKINNQAAIADPAPDAEEVENVPV